MDGPQSGEMVATPGVCTGCGKAKPMIIARSGLAGQAPCAPAGIAVTRASALLPRIADLINQVATAPVGLPRHQAGEDDDDEAQRHAKDAG